MIIISLFLAVLIGLLASVQTPTLTVLTGCIGRFEASAVNFLVGATFLTTAVFVTGSGGLSHLAEGEWWMYIGGIYGTCIILIMTYAAMKLGVALSLAMIMFGQLAAGCLVDGFGLFRSNVIEVGALRLAGCLVVAIGILFIYLGMNKASQQGVSKTMVICGVLAFAGGCIAAVQSATNTTLSVLAGPLQASLVNFLGGLAFTTIIVLVNFLRRRSVRKRQEAGAPAAGSGLKGKAGLRWWMFLCGIYGALAVTLTVIVTRYIGVALLVAATLLGQVGGGMAVDRFGLFGMPKLKTDKLKYIGVGIVFIGIILVTIARLS